MNLSSFRTSLLVTCFAFGCADDGSSGETNVAQTTDDAAAGTETTEAGDGTSTGGDETSSTTATDPGEETDVGDGSSSGGFLPECPEETQTCETLTPLAYCDLGAAVGVCFEYLHECNPIDMVEAGCLEAGGSFGMGACATEGALGTCIETVLPQVGSVYYEVEGLDAALAEQSCSDGGGSWCPG